MPGLQEEHRHLFSADRGERTEVVAAAAGRDPLVRESLDPVGEERRAVHVVEVTDAIGRIERRVVDRLQQEHRHLVSPHEIVRTEEGTPDAMTIRKITPFAWLPPAPTVPYRFPSAASTRVASTGLAPSVSLNW